MALQKISSLLPTQENMAAKESTHEALTEEEQQQAIDWAIKQKQVAYARSMADKGEWALHIEEKIKNIDWLAEIDVDNILQNAQLRKNRYLDEQTVKAKRLRETEKKMNELHQLCTYDYFFDLIRKYFIERNGKFLLNDGNERMIKSICYFFSGNPEFERMGNSFNKGLLIMGGCGLGKTRTITAISNNPLWPVSIFNMIDITDRIKGEGECELNTQRVIMLDDVGREETPVTYYGSKIIWFKEFIEKYYLHNKTYNGLIITTNLGGQEIENKYGYHIRSRFREMFNYIDVTGTDLR